MLPHFFFMAAIFLQTLIHPAWSDEAAGRVVSLSGKVLVRLESQDEAALRELKAGDSIRSGEIINTGSSGKVKLLMSDRTIIDLNSSTLFKVDEYELKGGKDRKVGLSIGYGKVRASVTQPVSQPGKFMIRTKSATMGVRGTEFLISADFVESGASPTAQVQTQLTVLQGQVEMASAASPSSQPTLIQQGERFTTQAIVSGDRSGALPSAGSVQTVTPTTAVSGVPSNAPQTLSSSELAQSKTEAKVEDTTFKKSVQVEAGNEPSSGSSGQKTWEMVSSSIQRTVQDTPPPPPLPLPGGLANPFGTLLPPPNLQGLPLNIQVVFAK